MKNTRFITMLCILTLAVASVSLLPNYFYSFADSDPLSYDELTINDNRHFYLDSPDILRAESSYIYTNSGRTVYRIDANNVVEVAVADDSESEFVDLLWNGNYMYILYADLLVEYDMTDSITNESGEPVEYNINDSNPTTITSLTDAVSLTIVGSDLFIVCNSCIVVYNLTDNTTCSINNAQFTSLSASTTNGTSLFVIGAGELFRITNDSGSFIVTKLFRISWQTQSEFVLGCFDNSFFVMENSSLKLLNASGEIIVDNLITPTIKSRGFVGGEIYACGDFAVLGNSIIIADRICGSIQKFDFADNRLTYESTIVASNGFDSGRLANAQDYVEISPNQYVIADTDNDRIELFDTARNLSTTLPVTTDAPFAIEIDVNSNFYLLDASGITSFTTSGIARTLSSDTSTLSALTSTANSEIFCLDSASDSILNISTTTLSTSVARALSFNLDSCSTMRSNASGSLLYINTSTSIYSISTTDWTITEIIAENEFDIISFTVDYLDTIYTLTRPLDIETSTTYSAINKYDYATQSWETVNVYESNSLYNLQINLCFGTFLVQDIMNSTLVEIEIESFANELTNFANDLSYFNGTPSVNGVEMARLSTSATAYEYPYNVSPLFTIDSDSLVILLDYQTDINPAFSYCLVADRYNYNVLCYIRTDSLSLEVANTTPSFEEVRVITATANVYSHPSTLPFEDSTDSCVLNDYRLSQGDVVDVISYTFDYTDNSATKFYEIRLSGGGIGYIKTWTAMNNELDTYQMTFQPNATARYVLSSDVIRVYKLSTDNTTYLPTNTILDDATALFVSGDIDTTQQWTKIVWTNEADEQLSGYIETRYVSIDDFTPHKYLGLVLLATCIALTILATTTVLSRKRLKRDRYYS